MKFVNSLLFILFVITSAVCQSISNCQVLEWTLDDFSTQHYNNHGYDIEANLVSNCGINSGGLITSDCVLVHITF